MIAGSLVAAFASAFAAAQQQPAAPPVAPVPAQTRPAEPSASNQVVHILIGHSVVIHTDVRLKRVLVGNPAVLTTTTTAPNEISVTAIGTGSSSLVIWQEDDRTRIVEVFADLDVSMLRDAIATSFPGEAIQVEAEEGRVMLSGTVTTQAIADQIVKMATPFSTAIVNSLRVADVARQKQVLLKVRFAEVDRTKAEAFGFNLFSLGATNTIGSTSTQQFGTFGLGNQNRLDGTIGAPTSGTSSSVSISDLLNLFVFRPDLNLGATIKDLQSKDVLQILAEPNLMAISGEPARFLAGGELPYPIVQPTVGGLSTVTVQFRPFGVRLEFTGTIQPDGSIRLRVAPEVSSLDYANAVTISGFTLPAISTRRAETVVDLKDGQSFGIAGLLDRRTTAQYAKVPGIADIPVLGQLFRSHATNRTNTELVVIVTPTVVDPLTAPAPPALPKAPLPTLDSPQFDKKLPKPTGGQ